MRLRIIAPGSLKKGPLLDLWNDYAKRMVWSLDIVEINARTTADEHAQIAAKIKPGIPLLALDERGQDLSSPALAQKMAALAQARGPDLQFLIGGADGLGDDLRGRADFLLAMGRATWPHKLVRIMLIEQLYRCQQILAGHPYHRE